MNKEIKDKIREICTYYGEGGTNGFLLDEDRFAKIFDLIDQETRETDDEIENRIRKLGTEIVKCSKCGQEIFWIRTKSGKAAPITLKLISHFADCPNANDFRKQ